MRDKVEMALLMLRVALVQTGLLSWMLLAVTIVAVTGSTSGPVKVTGELWNGSESSCRFVHLCGVHSHHGEEET